MNPGETVIGMAGYFISALMQTAGLHTLGEIIQQGGVLFAGLGYFIFLCSGLAALAAYGLFGDARRAGYFLVGPVLFYGILGTSTPYEYTAHQFGTRLVAESRTEIKQSMKDSMGQSAPKDVAVIPLFVAKFDAMVSSIIQGMVALIVDTDNRRDLQIAAQERLLSRVMTVTGEGVGFQALLAQAMMGECAEQMRLHSDLGSPRLAKAAPGSFEAAEVATKQASLAQLRNYYYPIHPKATEFLQQLGEPYATQATCDDIWEYTRIAALRFAEESMKPNPAETAEFDLTPQQWEEARTAVREKLIPKNANAADLDLAFKMIAGILLKNSIEKTTSGRLTAQLGGRRGFADEEKSKIFGNIASYNAVGAQMKITYFASMVPYLQGLILFLLSVSFPFFCIFLLMPGRIPTFFIWMGVWVWVKSWDIGFAIVTVLRELLWSFIPRAGQLRNGDTFNAVNWDDPATVFQFIYQIDPTLSTATYYMLVSTLTLAVPLITGQFCAGAVDLYSTLSSGFQHRGLQIQKNESKKPRIREMTRMYEAIQQKRLAAGEQGMKWGFDNPGRALGSNMSRAALGDATYQRHMIAQGKLSMMNYFWGEENRADVAYAQTLESRRDVKADGQAGMFLDAQLNYLNEPFVTGQAPGLGAILSSQNRDDRPVNFRLGGTAGDTVQTTDPLTGPAESQAPGGGDR